MRFFIQKFEIELKTKLNGAIQPAYFVGKFPKK